jgi:serine/threonine-protein kinase
MKAMAKSPDDRPQTAEQFRAELLAIEKERRASVGTTRGRPGSSSAPGLAQVARKVTPIDQQETRVNPPQQSPWGSNETTVRSSMPMSGPVPEALNTSPNTLSARDTTPGGGASSIIFKVATVLLVLLAISLAGLYGWNVIQRPKEVYVPPANAPLTGSGRPWEYDPPREKRRPGEGRSFASEGDEAWQKGAMEFALSRYLASWDADPQADTALKIGELYLQKDMETEARAWWARYRKDSPSAKAQPYIDAMLKN